MIFLVKPGDVLFVWGNALIDDAIEDITHGPSHVAIFVSEKRIAEAQGGIKVQENDSSFYSSVKTEIWTDPSLTDTEREAMVSFAKSLYGMKYDYFLIPLEFFHFEFGEKLGWFREHEHLICSTYVSTIAEKVGKHWAEVKNPAPVDLLRGGALKKY